MILQTEVLIETTHALDVRACQYSCNIFSESLHMIIQTEVLIETTHALDVRALQYSRNIFSNQGRAAMARRSL